MASGDVTTGGSTSGSTNPQVDKTATTLLKGLQTAYKGGVDVYGKPLYTAPSATTKSAWSQGSGFATDLLGSNGFGTGQQSAMDSLGGVFSGYGAAGDNSSSQLGQVFGGYGQLGDNNGLTGDQSSAMAGVGGLGGQYAGLGGLNATQQGASNNTAGLGASYGGLSNAYAQDAPGYQALRNKLTDDTLTGVGSLFASNGRYGSDIMGEAAGEGLGTALAGLDYGNYQNNVNNQYRALDSQKGIYDTLFSQGQQGRDNSMGALNAQQGVYGDVFNMGQTGVGNQMGALAGQAGTANSIFGNQTAALGGQAATAGQQFGMGQTALGNEQGAIGQLGAIGASKDADSLAKRMAAADLYDKTHNKDWNTLARASSIFNGTAPQTTQQSSTTVPWWQALLGGAATGASLLG